MESGSLSILNLRGISKRYPGKEKKANNNITVDLRKGEILCIAGENGAGKTTLMKILCGLEQPDEGEIIINGKKETINSPLAAKKLGIGMVHQHFMLFPEYTVAENIVMGVEPRKWGFFFDAQKAKTEVEKIIDNNNFQITTAQKVKELALGLMQQVEICRILYRDAQIIILDEPTSILTKYETRSLFKTLRNLASNGKSVILITHKLNEIGEVCDRVAVLRHGELIGIRNVSDIDEYEIARMMVGEDVSRLQVTPPQKPQNHISNNKPVIEFDSVTVKRHRQKLPLLDNVSFSVRSAEILGFAGVGGNGLGVIEAVLGGFLYPSQGSILHNGKDISAFNIRSLRREGLAYVPADRLRVASAADATIEENMVINRRHEFMKGFKNKRAIQEFSEKLAETYNIEGAKRNDKCFVLSGGNLQKLILAREIDCLKDYIVFSEPTWGLDIASSRFIMGEIEMLRKRGAAVILISTNLDEILTLANRIIVMYRGRIAGEYENTGDKSLSDKTLKEEIGSCMQGLGRKVK
jgi:simple sugar transport system ATP-binding protein